MSGQSLSPINTRIGFSRKDKSHFSNDETWRASWGNYLNGPIDDLIPDEWQRESDALVSISRTIAGFWIHYLELEIII